ncbi:hypothetical protein LCGC14_2321340, partial [marine sediment metagenome]
MGQHLGIQGVGLGESAAGPGEVAHLARVDGHDRQAGAAQGGQQRHFQATGGLQPGAVVVVDEAGMVGSRQLAQVSDLVEEASGKLILIGDHHQLAEIDAGGLFAALTMRLPSVELTENVRQRHEWE